jgi:hypothetical protein
MAFSYFHSYGDNPYVFQSYANVFQPILVKETQHPLILIQSYAGSYTSAARSYRLKRVVPGHQAGIDVSTKAESVAYNEEILHPMALEAVLTT